MDTLQKNQMLMNALQREDLQLLQDLLEEEASLNAIHSDGKTLLTAAVEQQKRQVVEFLVRLGAKLDQRDMHDSTPLIYAVDRPDTTLDSLRIAQLLLASGADVNATNRQGRTALMYAADRDAPDMVRLLLEAGADFTMRDRTGKTAREYCTRGSRAIQFIEEAKKKRKARSHFWF